MSSKFRLVSLLVVLTFTTLAAVAWTLTGRASGVQRPLWQPPIKVLMQGRASRWWIFYAGPDGQIGTGDDLVARDNLHVPAGCDVHLQLRSDDYIYVFSVPALGLKEIAVPGLEHSLIFHAGPPETLAVQGDVMCGRRTDHDERLMVQNPAEFESWLASVRRAEPVVNR